MLYSTHRIMDVNGCPPRLFAEGGGIAMLVLVNRKAACGSAFCMKV
jgi:hypothetical protein